MTTRKGRPDEEFRAARSQQHPEPSPHNREAARALTDRIKVAVEAAWELIKQAYTERAWEALGYQSWDDYCTREFGTSRLRLPREERTEVVCSLRDAGLSVRAIASATGDHYSTVSRELGRVANATPGIAADPVADDFWADPFDYPDTEPVAATTRPTPGRAEVMPVIGMDGKTYQRKPLPQPAPKPWRKPPSYCDEFSRAVYDLERLVERFAGLVADDRYAIHRAALNRSCFLDLRVLLHEVITDLEPAL
jgi:hypothetical protein